MKRFVPGGNLTQTILDGEMYTFGSPLALMNGTAVLAGPRLFIEAQDSDGAMRLYRYDYDPEAPIGAASTLRVWALEDSDALRQAVSLFRRSHPETKVQLELALDASSGAGVTAEDAVRTLNTLSLIHIFPPAVCWRPCGGPGGLSPRRWARRCAAPQPWAR